MPAFDGAGVGREGAGGLPERLVAPGRGARLDLPPRGRRRRRRERLGPRPARPDPGGRGHGALGVPGPASSDERGGRRAVRVRHGGATGSVTCPASCSGETIATWCLAEPRQLGPPDRRLARRRPGGRRSSCSRARRDRPKAAAEAGILRGGRPGRRRGHAVPGRRGHARCHRGRGREHRPRPALCHRVVRRRRAAARRGAR